MKRILLVLLFSMVANAALEQSYVQTVARDGSSTIQKSMDVSLFSTQLPPDALQRMSDTCQILSSMQCSVENTTVTITERFPAQTGYYSFSTEYGIPFITHKLVVRRIPADIFASDLDRLLAASNATAAQSGSTPAIDLTQNNSEIAYYLKLLKMNASYTVNMPAQVDSGGTPRGEISGASVRFDLASVLEQGGTMTVTSRELNLGYLTILAMIVVLGALALSFFKTTRRRNK